MRNSWLGLSGFPEFNPQASQALSHRKTGAAGFPSFTRAKSRPWTTTAATNSRWAYESIRSEEHTSELQSLTNLVCRLLLEKKKERNTVCHRPRCRQEPNDHE